VCWDDIISPVAADITFVRNLTAARGTRLAPDAAPVLGATGGGQRFVNHLERDLLNDLRQLVTSSTLIPHGYEVAGCSDRRLLMVVDGFGGRVCGVGGCRAAGVGSLGFSWSWVRCGGWSAGLRFG
jgi:hypothetical protein